jgi:hypothetical protein
MTARCASATNPVAPGTASVIPPRLTRTVADGPASPLDELRVRLEHDLLILPVIVDEAEEQSKAAEPGSLFAVALHRVPRRVIGVRPQEHLFLALRIRVHLSRLARSIGEGFQRRTGSS